MGESRIIMTIEYSDKINKQIFDHLGELKLKNIMQLETASFQEDTELATDKKLSIKKSISVRVREPNCKSRDLTIRWATKYGNETEYDKIKKGLGQIYYYGWKSDDNNICEYVIVDIDKLRKNDRFKHPGSKIENNDGTKFVALKIEDIRECIITHEIL